MRHLTVTGTRTRRLHGGDALGHQLRLRHQAGAEASLLHAIRRAADVEVDLVVAEAPRRSPPPRRAWPASEPPSCSATGCSSGEKPSSRSRSPRSTASAVTISVYSSALPRQQPMEEPAMPIRPIHHRRDAEPVRENLHVYSSYSSIPRGSQPLPSRACAPIPQCAHLLCYQRLKPGCQSARCRPVHPRHHGRRADQFQARAQPAQRFRPPPEA